LQQVQQLIPQLATLTASTCSLLAVGKVGFSKFAKYEVRLADDLWLCVATPPQNKSSWEQIWQVCNEEGGFYLASVGPMTLRGKPSAEAWDAARKYFIELGYLHVVTGQPVWNCHWKDWEHGFSKNGLACISFEEDINGPNWNALVDGNEGDGRTWANSHSANFPKALVTLCMNAEDIKSAKLYNHIWRA